MFKCFFSLTITKPATIVPIIIAEIISGRYSSTLLLTRPILGAPVVGMVSVGCGVEEGDTLKGGWSLF